MVHRWRGAAVAAGLVLLVLSACGEAAGGDGVASAGGEENPANPADAEQTEALDADEQALVFAGCMRDNGIDMPDPDPGQQGLVDAFQSVSGDYDRATLAQAMSSCEDLLPQYPREQQHSDEWMLAVAECLREQGLDVSDNPFADAHTGVIDQREFAAAMEECRNVLSGGGQ